MPLRSGTSRKTISDNIRETLESPTFGEGKSKAKRRQMAIAAAMRKKRETLSQAAFRRRRRKP